MRLRRERTSISDSPSVLRTFPRLLSLDRAEKRILDNERRCFPAVNLPIGLFDGVLKSRAPPRA